MREFTISSPSGRGGSPLGLTERVSALLNKQMDLLTNQPKIAIYIPVRKPDNLQS